MFNCLWSWKDLVFHHYSNTQQSCTSWRGSVTEVRDTHSKIQPNGKISPLCPTFSWFFPLSMFLIPLYRTLTILLTSYFKSYLFHLHLWKILSEFQIIYNVTLFANCHEFWPWKFLFFAAFTYYTGCTVYLYYIFHWEIKISST